MATGLLIGSLVAGVAGATATGVSVHQQNKALKEQKKAQKAEEQRIQEEKAQALEKRKQLIDQQRYNLLGSSDTIDTTSNSNNSSFSLLGNNQTLG